MHLVYFVWNTSRCGVDGILAQSSWILHIGWFLKFNIEYSWHSLKCGSRTRHSSWQPSPIVTVQAESKETDRALLPLSLLREELYRKNEPKVCRGKQCGNQSPGIFLMMEQEWSYKWLLTQSAPSSIRVHSDSWQFFWLDLGHRPRLLV